ncbi:MAG: hypothetical protein ABSD50_12525, partial [Smithella sp.]
FNDYNSGNFNSSTIPEYGPFVNEGSSSTVSGVSIYFYPSNGSGSGTGSGTTPSTTPLPGAFPLFGFGLALLWLLSKKSKS